MKPNALLMSKRIKRNAGVMPPRPAGAAWFAIMPMIPSILPLLLGLGLALTSGLAGCASPKQTLPPEPSHDGVVSKTAEPSSGVRAQSISVQVPSRSTFKAWTSKPVDRTLVMTREREVVEPGTDAAARAWIIRRFVVDPADPEGSGGKLTRESRIVVTEGGGIAISRELNYSENVRVEFTPPMSIIPAELRSGGAHTSGDVRMVVRPLNRPDQIKAQGTVRHSTTYEADETLRTPAGTFETYRLVSRFEADLGASTVENVTYQWFAPDIGMVAERRHEQTRALGLTIRNNREEWVLAGLGSDSGGSVPTEQ